MKDTKVKQTEIGKIPEGWSVQEVRDIGKVITGKTPPIKDRKYFGTSYPFIKIPDMGISVRVASAETMLSHEGAQYMNNLKLPPGSVMVSCLATIGKVGITVKESFTNQQINTIIPDTSKVIPKWIYYFFKNSTEYLESLGGGGSVYTNISKSRFENAHIGVPPLSEQHAITKILSDLDDKIELNNQMNKTLESIAKAIFKQWFVDFEPWGGEQPDDWQNHTLGDVSTLSAGGDRPKVFSEKPSITCTIPIYSNGIDNDGLYGYTNSAKIVDESVTVSARGTIGFTCLRQVPYFPIVRLISLVPNPKYLSAKYMYLWLKSINISGTGTTQQQLTVPDFKKTEILIPTPEVMRQFTIIADSIFAQITTNKNENTVIIAIRDSLLPKLMSGKIRVN